MKDYTFKVVGVNFKNADGRERQAVLKELFREAMFDGTDSFEVDLGPYEYEGAPALAVCFNGQEIGNIAADQVETVMDLKDKADFIDGEIKLNGQSPEEIFNLEDMIRNAKEYIRMGIFTEYDLEEYKEERDFIKADPQYSAVITITKMDQQPPEEPQKEEVDTQPEQEHVATAGKTAPETKEKPSKGIVIVAGALIALGLILTFTASPVGLIPAALGALALIGACKGPKK